MLRILFILFILLGLSSLSSCIDSERTGRQAVDLITDEIAEEPVAEPTATPAITRPNNAVFIKNDYCSCLKGKADLLNNCSAYCSKTNTPQATLFVNTELGTEITFSSYFGNLYNWCRNPIPGEGNPDCALEIYDGTTTSTLSVNISPGSNRFSIVIDPGLKLNTTYVATLVAIPSGARSTSFQIRRFTPEDEDPNKPTLSVRSISLYSCVNRATATSGDGNYYYDYAIKQHYIFPDGEDPPSLPPSSTQGLFCHDLNISKNDSPLLPRLELYEHFIYVWDKTDPKFADQYIAGGDMGHNEILDVNDLIKDRLLEEYEISVNGPLTIFVPFAWPSYPISVFKAPDSSTSASDTPFMQGYYMQPWIDPDTGKTFCPTQIDYNKSFESIDRIPNL